MANIKLKKIFDRWRKNLEPYTWWELTIFVIGIVSFISILVVLFLPIRNGPGKFTLTAPLPAVTEPGFLPMISSSLSLPHGTGSSITILNNGDEFLASFLKDVDEAKSSINIMDYIWDKGKMSDQIFAHLDEKLKQGVEVRIMLDAFGGNGATGREEFKNFTKLGGKVEVFHSLTILPWNLSSYQKRNHRRAFIVDGKIGYTGGVAISDSWLGNASNEKEYRDMMFRMTGGPVADLQGIFAELWSNDSGEILSGDAFFPPTTASNTSGNFSYVSVSSVPSPDILLINKFLLMSLLAAKEKIYMTTPYFLPDSAMRDVLESKAKEGLDVRLLLPNKLNDSRGVRHASEYWYSEMLKAGVKIYEYQPTFIHVKSMVIDGAWSVIGSANMDARSRKLNDEDLFGVLDKNFGSQMETVFNDNLKKAQEIKAEDWDKRSLFERALEVFDLKFVEQY